MTYSLQVDAYSEHVKLEKLNISVIVTWIDKDGKWLRREYIEHIEQLGNGWSRWNGRIVTPEATAYMKMELEFKWAPGGIVYWCNAVVKPTDAIQQRSAKIVTTYLNLNSENRRDLSNNLKIISDTIDQAGELAPDLICFAESMYTRGFKYNKQDVAQPIPGQLTTAIAAMAKKWGTHIVFNMLERDGQYIFNTSVLFGRQGKIIGKYRKVHLPLSEVQAGVSPGNDYPVFETDIGKIGMLICWDQRYPESARALRLNGAEIICISTAGYAKQLNIARAIENGVYIVVAGVNGDISKPSDKPLTGKPSRIISPDGEIQAEIGPGDAAICSVNVDLGQPYYKYWLSVGPAYGEPRKVLIKERRPDTYGKMGG
jgi:predicted amidohydrolase